MRFFAIAALMATASAVRLSSTNAVQQGPPSWEDVLEVLDSDNSGTVSWEEIMDFVKEMEKQHGEKMPEDMKKELKKMFDYVDKDGSGDIDKAEFEAAIKAHGAMGQQTRKGFSQLLAQQGPPSWEDVLEVLDSDDSGTVSWEEIMDFVKEMEKEHGQKMPEDMKKELKKMFDYVDKDGSGDIDKAEFEAAVKAHGAMGQKTRKGFTQLLAQQGPPSWEDVLEVLDSDDSGTVSWEEIMDFVKEMEKQHGEKMPEDMKKELKKMFDYVDKDGSGDIDKAEFEAAIKAHGAMGQKTRKGFNQLLAQQGGAPQWDDLLAMLDSDQSGTISWGEIEDWLHSIEEEHNKMWNDMKEELKKMFEYIDSNGSGDVDKAEFEAAMKAHGALAQNARKQLRKLAQLKAKGGPEWEDLLAMLDSDQSGTISWGEIEDWLHTIEEEYNAQWDEMKQQVKQMFEYIDKDGSGDIDKNEFEAAVKGHGALAENARRQLRKLAQTKAKQGPPSWEDVLEVLDEDGSGTVSWDEIVSFIKKVEKEHNVKISKKDKQAIKAAFEQVDTDGSGDIDKAEFEAALKAMEGLAQLKKYM